MPDNVIAILDAEFANAFREMEREAIPLLRGQLDSFQYKFRNNLYNSLVFQLDKDAEGPFLQLSMPFYGKTLERKHYFAHGATTQELAEWVASKGIDKWSYVPGYEDGGDVPENWAYRIALGMQNSRGKESKVRPTRGGNVLSTSWLYRPFLGLWASKRNEIQDRYLEVVHGDILSEVRQIYQRSAQSFLGKK